MIHRLARVRAVLVAALALAAGSASAANASIEVREHYSFTDTETWDDCGFEVHSEIAVSGVLTFRQEKPGSSAYLASDRFTYRSVDTNPENGKWMVFRGKGSFKDIKATHVDGDIYHYRTHRAGQINVIENSDGDVLLRDSGVVVFDIVVDTGGDDDPDAEVLSFEIATIHGPHESLTGDICPTVTELIG